MKKETLYPYRSRANSILRKFSQKAIGNEANRKLNSYHFEHGYHVLGIDLDKVRQVVFNEGQKILAEILADITDIGYEFAKNVTRTDFHYLGSVGDLSWLVALCDAFLCEGQVTAVQNRFVVAQPNFWVMYNFDDEPITLSRCKFNQSFETQSCLDLNSAKKITLNPGELLKVDGFKEVVFLQSSG